MADFALLVSSAAKGLSFSELEIMLLSDVAINMLDQSGEFPSKLLNFKFWELAAAGLPISASVSNFGRIISVFFQLEERLCAFVNHALLLCLLYSGLPETMGFGCTWIAVLSIFSAQSGEFSNFDSQLRGNANWLAENISYRSVALFFSLRSSSRCSLSCCSRISSSFIFCSKS